MTGRARATWVAVALSAAALGASRPARADEPLLRPTLLAEADARALRSPTEGTSGFSLARVRPGLRVEPAPWMRAVTVLELVPSPRVLDAFALVRAAPWLELEAGQSKTPIFASFRWEPVHTLSTPDRSPVVTAFRVQRDVGVGAHLTPAELPLEALVRVGSGSESTVSRTLLRPALYGAFDVVLGRAHVARARGDELLGLRLGVAGLTERVDERAGVAGAGPTRFVFYRPPQVAGERVVVEAHAIAYAGPLRAVVEAAVAREQRARDADGNPSTPAVALPSVVSSGLTAELAWVVRGRARRVGRLPDPESPGDFGTVELTARYDALALGRGAADVPGGGYRGGTLAAKWWATSFAALAAAGSAGVYDAGPTEDPARTDTFTLLLRASFYWGIAPPTTATAAPSPPPAATPSPGAS